MQQDYLTRLVEKYGSQFIIRGTEFMMQPEIAAALARDLAKAGEIILGCDGWRYVNLSKMWIVQDLEIELVIEEHIPWDEMSPQRNAEMVQSFIAALPERIDLVSLELNDPVVSQKLIEEASRS